LTPSEHEEFICSHAALTRPPLVPELSLWLAEEATALWEASEVTLNDAGVPPPFWTFAWAGGKTLARFVLDQPETVLGKRVLDFGSGSGIVGLAATMAGAA
jgi:predicted nicotinamide N-methyase